ncbi:MAG: hypothetical protein ABIL58_06955 [Pseudomonadota bacterium]
MTIGEVHDRKTERLEEFITRARSGKPVQLRVMVFRSMVKQVVQSESTDDIQDESDMNLLMAAFTPVAKGEIVGTKVTKVYAISPINEIEVNAKTTQRIANERLKMDYARLKAAGVKFEEKFF